MAKKVISDAEQAFMLGQTSTEETNQKSTAKLTQKVKQETESDKSTKSKGSSANSGLFSDLAKQAKPVRFTIDLDPSLSKRFEAGAKKYKMPKAKFLRAIMERAFDDMNL